MKLFGRLTGRKKKIFGIRLRAGLLFFLITAMLSMSVSAEVNSAVIKQHKLLTQQASLEMLSEGSGDGAAGFRELETPPESSETLPGSGEDKTEPEPSETLPGSEEGKTEPEPSETLPGSEEGKTEPEPSETLPGSEEGRTEPEPSEILPDNEDDEKEEKVTASVTLKNSKNALISWKKVKGAVAYKVQRAGRKKGKFTELAVLDSSARKYTDDKAERGNYYDYRIAAEMEDGSYLYSDKLAFACPLGQVSGVKLIRYSTSSIKAVWKKSRQAEYYKVYYAESKSGSYQCAGTTKNLWYRVKGLKNNQAYYFKVKACAAKKSSKLDGKASAAAKMKTRTYARTTIFAGDSITTGLSSYRVLDKIGIGGNKSIVAAVGLNTATFRTRKQFAGLSAMGSVIASKPYRVYIMLGTNEIHYRSSSDVAAGYREIVKAVKAGTPDTDIVLLAVPPVASSTRQSKSGFAQIPALNQKIKEMADSMGVRYYDYTGFLKDAGGCLQHRYAAGDGIHWTSSAYHEFAKQIEKYDKSLD